MTEEGACSFVEIPIDLKTHDVFMRALYGIDVRMKIKNGHYRVYYTNPIDLFHLGMRFNTYQSDTNFLSHLKLTVNTTKEQ